MALKEKEIIGVGSKKIEISNPDKILFPKVKITKKELIQYYDAVAPLMIPLIKNHPITLQRYPAGIEHEGFFQKDAGSYFPSWIKTERITHSQGTVRYVVATSPATIVYLANQATITIHEWLSRTDKLRYPDRMIFDLDPAGKDFNQVRYAALDLKKMFDDLKMRSFVMTTGSHGLHVVVPLKRKYTFEQVADYAYSCAQKLVEQNPQRYTLELRKEKRGKKIFIDTLRNRWSATAVAPYSVRPTEWASVAVPLSWHEVKSAKLRSDMFTIADVKKICARKTEWSQFTKTQNSLK
jgi:bifunctional non-homologous end joining protein LigD